MSSIYNEIQIDRIEIMAKHYYEECITLRYLRLRSYDYSITECLIILFAAWRQHKHYKKLEYLKKLSHII